MRPSGCPGVSYRPLQGLATLRAYLVFLGAKSTSIRDCVRRSVGRLVGPSPTMRLRGKLVTSRLLREEEKEEETDYVAIPLRRDSFAARD
jgi:hypothetical protein